MINYVFVLNENFEKIGIIDIFISLIWDKKYNDFGEFELYIPATTTNFDLIKTSKYVVRPDDDMVGLISKIELDTSAEKGDYLIVSGKSAESLLNQRILISTQMFDGLVEDLIRKVIDISILNPENFDPDPPEKRRMYVPVSADYYNARPLIQLGAKINYPERIVTQVSYKPVGDIIKELCKLYNIGFKLAYSGDHLTFDIYEGEDLSSSVIFSERFNNLVESKYIADNSDLANFALIGGAGEGIYRVLAGLWGLESSTNRYEIFIDAKDITRDTNFGDLKKMFPDGEVVNSTIGGTERFIYQVPEILFPLYTEEQEIQIFLYYPYGTKVEIDGKYFWKETYVEVAEFTEETYDDQGQPIDNAAAFYEHKYYCTLLIQRALEKLVEHTSKTSFEGQIIPDVNYKYKIDYNLGDIVKIQNKYGISVKARITEVLESFSDEGYKIEPKYEYITTESEE